MFTAAKDAMTGKAAQVFLNERIANYGKVQRLKIDSRNRTVEATCLLHGETDPVEIAVGNYIIEGEGTSRTVQLRNCTCSRTWMQNLLRDFAEGRRFPLPSWVANAIT